MRDLSRNRSEPFAMSGASSYAGLTMMAVLSFTMLTNVDAFLARHYLNASDAGNYSALSVLGRVAFYAPSGVAAALFPKASEMFVNGGNHRRILVKALVLTLVIAAGVVLVYGAAPQRISQFLFDERYILIAPYLVKYAASMALSAVSFLLMNYFLSVNKEKIAYALLGIAVFQITLLVLFHASIAQLVDIMLVSGALSIIALVPFVFLGKEKRREGKTGGIGFNPGKSVTEQKIK
jgi:O-antigen/teichoic acid export membrane protein